MQRRRKWLHHFGGLERISIKNEEWLALLEEETRHSLMIEGEFFDKFDLEEILEKGKYKSAREVLGYFEAATSAYELAFQQYQEGEFHIDKALIRQIHAMMFRNVLLPRHFPLPGEWRSANMTIRGAKVQPPSPEKIRDSLEKVLLFINQDKEMSPTRKAAFLHAFFEYIHPFPDGNGRSGRVLMNFVLVANGFPNVAIKGFESEKKKYFSALEEADIHIGELLKGRMSWSRLPKSFCQNLENLIEKNLAIALDRIICGRFSQKEDLVPIRKMAIDMNKSPDAFAVACSQKKYISHNKGGRLMSHVNLLADPI